jgi:hypothetical protein
MRNIKIDRVANGRPEWLQCFSAFQILGAVALVKRDASDSVVFLRDQLLLQHGCRLGFVFEELAIATFADLWPGYAPKWATFDFDFAELGRSFAHRREWSNNG